jgi:hypothetical protein
MAQKKGRTVKIVGNMMNSAEFAVHPKRVNYAQVTDECHTTMGAASMEEVFIPFYDRPGYKTDNEARTQNDRMFRINAGNGQMEERDLGA